jgi:hypothetical protein
MSVLSILKNPKQQSKVLNSQYITSEDKPDEAETKPAEPESPTQPEAK